MCVVILSSILGDNMMVGHCPDLVNCQGQFDRGSINQSHAPGQKLSRSNAPPVNGPFLASTKFRGKITVLTINCLSFVYCDTSVFFKCCRGVLGLKVKGQG